MQKGDEIGLEDLVVLLQLGSSLHFLSLVIRENAYSPPHGRLRSRARYLPKFCFNGQRRVGDRPPDLLQIQFNERSWLPSPVDFTVSVLDGYKMTHAVNRSLQQPSIVPQEYPAWTRTVILPFSS